MATVISAETSNTVRIRVGVLQHTRIAVAFACWNFLLVFSLQTIKSSSGQMRRLYVYIVNESTLNSPGYYEAWNK